MNDLLDWCVAIYNDKLPQPLVSDFMVPFNIGHSFLRHVGHCVFGISSTIHQYDSCLFEDHFRSGTVSPKCSMLWISLRHHAPALSLLRIYPGHAICPREYSHSYPQMTTTPQTMHSFSLLLGKKQRTWELQLLEHRIQTQPGSSKEKEAFNIFKAPLQQAPATFSVAGIKYDDQGHF